MVNSYIGLLRKEAGSDYGISFPDFPGCVTAGRDPNETRRLAEEALALHMEGLLADGETLPTPSSLEALLADTDNLDAEPVRIDGPEPKPRTVTLTGLIDAGPLAELVRPAERRSSSKTPEISEYNQSYDDSIVAVFDTPAHAELAVQDLLAAHVPASAVERHTAEGSYAGDTGSEPVRKVGGFLSSLFGGGNDATTYHNTLSSGGTVVTVHGIPTEDFDRVAAILEQHNPIDFDNGMAGSTTGMGATGMSSTAVGATGLAGTTVPATGTRGDTLQLSEESLVVGKRLVNQGGTRIRRYVVEKPVEQNISLHDERVVVERRPVADGRAVDASAFTGSDRVIEMTETTEQAVVGKTARVVEEVALRREGVDRAETIHETVRKEEVEIVKVPGGEPPLPGSATPRKI